MRKETGVGNRWSSRSAEVQDGEAIVELFQVVFGSERSHAHWIWKFANNPTDRMFVCIADDHGRIVGHHALIPTFMNLSGLMVLGAQGVDTMTHPAYRRQGMFVSLAKDCFSKATLEGTQLLYRFPNEKSYPGFVEKLGWRDLGRLQCLLKVTKPEVVTAVIRNWVRIPALASMLTRPACLALRVWAPEHHPELTRNIGIRRVHRFDDRFDALWAKVKDTLSIAVWKDSRYLNWRYISCPDTDYTVLAAEEEGTLVGFTVVKLIDRRPESMRYIGLRRVGYIVDLVCLPDRSVAASMLIRAALDYLRGCGSDFVLCHMFEHSPFYRLVRDQGFFKYDRASCSLVVRENPTGATSGVVFDLKKWHLMEGDVDTF